MISSSNKATIIGLSAILLWSLIVALIKEVTSNFGAVGGSALIYSTASIFLFFSIGWTKLKEFPLKYLIIGGVLFILYELCVSLSIGYTTTNQQAIEIGLINYLWPTFTIIFAIFFNKQKANFFIIPGFCLSILGIFWVLGSDQGVSIRNLIKNINENPLSYGLAFLGTILWASYCTITTKFANGKNGITLFFILVSIVLWIKWFSLGEFSLHFDIKSFIYLLIAAFAMGFGYSAWNIGILHGNVTFLATASYFIPIISAIVSAIILKTYLPVSFWQGTIMVCFGAILCWMATKRKK